MSYHDYTLPSYAPVGYDEWKKKQDANKAASSVTNNTLNSSVFKDETSKAISDAAMKAASQNVAQSVANGNYLFYGDIIPQGMKDGFTEYQHEQIIKGLKGENQGSVITGGIPIAGFSPILDEVAKKTSEEGKTIKDVVTESKGTDNKTGGTAAPKNDNNDVAKDVPADTNGDILDLSGVDVYVGGGDGGYSVPSFQTSGAFNKAWDYTSSLLEKLKGGRTSYSDQIDALINKYMNREKFTYDADTDPLFQQMLASAMNSGKLAMEDTIGTAASLTGGYGSSYATRAGNSAYNEFVTDAYNNLPDYYNLALQTYQMEGDDMLSQLGVLRDADDTEYGRLLNEYNVNFNHANAIYDREYSQFQSDRDFNYNSYWDEKNFDYNSYWDEKNFDYNASQDKQAQQNWQTQFDYNASQDKLAQENWEKEFEYEKEQDKSKWNYQTAQDSYAAQKKEDELANYKTPTEKMYSAGLAAAVQGGEAGFLAYADSIPDYDADAIGAQVQNLLTFTKTIDTTNGFGGLDHNDAFVDGYGRAMTLDAISEAYGLSNSQLKELTKLKEGETINLSGLEILEHYR